MSRSTCIEQVKSDGSKLFITFKSGKIYQYENAGHLLPDAAAAESLGQWFNLVIKNRPFKYTLVKNAL